MGTSGFRPLRRYAPAPTARIAINSTTPTASPSAMGRGPTPSAWRSRRAREGGRAGAGGAAAGREKPFDRPGRSASVRALVPEVSLSGRGSPGGAAPVSSGALAAGSLIGTPPRGARILGLTVISLALAALEVERGEQARPPRSVRGEPISRVRSDSGTDGSPRIREEGPPHRRGQRGETLARAPLRDRPLRRPLHRDDRDEGVEEGDGLRVPWGGRGRVPDDERVGRDRPAQRRARARDVLQGRGGVHPRVRRDAPRDLRSGGRLGVPREAGGRAGAGRAWLQQGGPEGGLQGDRWGGACQGPRARPCAAFHLREDGRERRGGLPADW